MSFRLTWKVVVYLLFVFYVVFVVICMHRSLSLLDFVRAHPERVNFAAHELLGRISAMKAFMPVLISNPRITGQRAEAILMDQWDNQDLCLEEIVNASRGDRALKNTLQKGLEELRRAVLDALPAMIGKASLREAEAWYERGIDPRVLAISTNIAKIMGEATEQTGAMRQSIRRQMEYTMYVSILFGLGLFFATMIMDRRDRLKNLEIEDREQMLTMVSQNLDEVFIIVDDRGVFQYVSPVARNILGKDASAIIEHPAIFYDFLTPDAAFWLKNVIRGSLLEEKQIVFVKNGKFYRLQAYNVVNGHKLTGTHIIVLNDQTESSRIERALRDALENARMANKAKSLFIARMRQEMGQPAEAIASLAANALHAPGNAEMMEQSLREISRLSEHIHHVIGEARDMGSLGKEELALSRDPFNLGDFIRDMVSWAQPYARGKDQSLEVVADIGKDDYLEGDTARLRQVLINIISNAVKFTPPEGAIVFRVCRLPDAGDRLYYRFTVLDSGKGMSPELTENLFAPFDRASGQPATGETGLGMPVAYNLVTLMGGTISVKSRPGEGSEFTVDVPFSPANKIENDSGEI